jgi:hypothetical protein
MPRTKRLFLTEAEVDELLDMGLALKALEEVFKARPISRSSSTSASVRNNRFVRGMKN